MSRVFQTAEQTVKTLAEQLEQHPADYSEITITFAGVNEAAAGWIRTVPLPALTMLEIEVTKL